MVSPIDYTMDVLNPFQAATQGFNAGLQTVNNLNAVKANQAEEERRKQAAIQQQVMNEDLYKFSNIPNKTAEDYANIIGRYPTLAEPYQKAWNMMDAERQKQTLGTASQLFAALSNGSNQVAKDIISKEIKGLENSGMKREAFNMQNILKLIDTNPQAALSSIGMLMSSANPEQFKNVTDSLNSTQMQPYDIAKTQAETGKIKAETQGQNIENQYKPQQLQSGINQTQSQTALNYANIQNLSDRLRLDQDKLQTEAEFKFMELNPSNVKLSDGAQKLVNDNMVESVALEQSANKMDDLANRFEKESQAGGLYTKGWAGFKRITGWSNDDQNAMIREYSRLRNSEAIKSLPPGPATDRDIELALRGLPPETADSSTLTSFLRGYAKLNRMDSAYKQMQAEWVNQVGNMGSTKRDVEVLGVKIPAGTTFTSYATKNLNKALKTQANQAVQRQISTGQRSYMSAVQ